MHGRRIHPALPARIYRKLIPNLPIIAMSNITINTADDIAGMRIAGRLGAEVLDYITPFVKPGVTTG